ncbi:MAG TPA: rhomboid family intramembrane serine protease [Vicinamibacterales bacterium]|nr:rhomboid family intramembrane serine protease [Vicinamibacterales bacterium]
MSRRLPSNMSYTFGPGPVTPAVRGIIAAAIAVFVVELFAPVETVSWLGLTPAAVIGQGKVWQVVTYLFVHSPTSFTHILFNLLAVWMFGVDLEKRWGTAGFLKYFAITGVGAGLTILLLSRLSWAPLHAMYDVPTIGCSGAVYGLLLAWAILFPNRPILFMLIFPISARAYALILGGIAFLSALSATGGPVSNAAHLSGLLIGWLYLKGPRNLRLELEYSIARWRMQRVRRRFSVHKGGRDDWEHRVH